MLHFFAAAAANYLLAPNIYAYINYLVIIRSPGATPEY